jgi:hypothetical protein
MKYFIAFTFAFCFTTNINAQDKINKDSLEVATVIHQLFTAMKTSDTNMLKPCFSSNAVFQTIVNKNGSTEV